VCVRVVRRVGLATGRGPERHCRPGRARPPRGNAPRQQRERATPTCAEGEDRQELEPVLLDEPPGDRSELVLEDCLEKVAVTARRLEKVSGRITGYVVARRCQRLSAHAAAVELDPLLSLRTSVNVVLEMADGLLVELRRSATVLNSGAFDIPSEVLDHNDLVTGGHGWTASMLDVAQRTASEEVGVTDLDGARITACAWHEDIAAALAFAHVRAPLRFDEVRSTWSTCAGRDESSEIFPLPDGAVNAKVDFARSVC